VRDLDNNPHEGIIRSSFVLDPTGKVIIEHRGVSDINPVKDINDLLNELSA
jgi:peroxiredoxin